MFKTAFPLMLLILSGLSLRGAAQTGRPAISHEPPASVVAGQALRLVARVGGDRKVESVTLHLAQSGGAAPVAVPMRPAGAGVYSARIDPELFSDAASFRYYLEAEARGGVRTESDWSTVKVIGRDTAGGPPAKPGWKRPALIGAGAAVAVGAGVAIAGGGGGGGGNEGDGGGGGGGAVDPADQVVVRTASDDVDTPNPALPKVTSVDVSGDLGGRSVNRVRVRLEFDGVDGGEEAYEASYNGSTILSGTAGGGVTEQVDVVGAADTQVLVRVTASNPVDGTTTYRWNATVTFFLE